MEAPRRFTFIGYYRYHAVGSLWGEPPHFGCVAEWLKALDCKSGAKASQVRILPHPPTFKARNALRFLLAYVLSQCGQEGRVLRLVLDFAGSSGTLSAQTDILMKTNLSHSRCQGDTSESAAVLYYTMKGFVVSKPLSHSPRYDIIVDDGETIFRVECKSSRCKGSGISYQVSLVTSGGNRSSVKEVKRICSEKTDIVFIMDGDGNVYEVPAIELSGRKCVNVNQGSPWFKGNIGLAQVA